MLKQYKIPGFSLIEILIALSIVGILSAIAIPSYSRHVKKSRRSEALTALLTTQRAYELYFVQNSTYPSSGSSLPSSTYYTYSSSTTASTYTLTATATVGLSQVTDTQGAITCTPLTLDNVGNKSPVDCWNAL
jgi:type IV pilus assembly protein PilE